MLNNPQLEVLQSRMTGSVLQDAARKSCAYQIACLQRVVAADEAGTKSLQDLATK